MCGRGAPSIFLGGTYPHTLSVLAVWEHLTSHAVWEVEEWLPTVSNLLVRPVDGRLSSGRTRGSWPVSSIDSRGLRSLCRVVSEPSAAGSTLSHRLIAVSF